MFKNQGRRGMDRFPITDRVTWAVLRHLDRARRIRPADVVGYCSVAAFWLLLAYCATGGKF